jgi:hypothetical protein
MSPGMRAPFTGDAWFGFLPGTQSAKLYSLLERRRFFNSELLAFGSPDHIAAGCDVRLHQCHSVLLPTRGSELADVKRNAQSSNPACFQLSIIANRPNHSLIAWLGIFRLLRVSCRQLVPLTDVRLFRGWVRVTGHLDRSKFRVAKIVPLAEVRSEPHHYMTIDPKTIAKWDDVARRFEAFMQALTPTTEGEGRFYHIVSAIGGTAIPNYWTLRDAHSKDQQDRVGLGMSDTS